MTIDEEDFLSRYKPKSVPRLGVKGSSHVERYPRSCSRWTGEVGTGRRLFRRLHFLKELDWVKRGIPDLIRRAAEVEGYEARYVFQSSKYNQGGIVIPLTKR